MSVAPEDVARATISIFEDGYSDSLSTVATARDATETITLTDFVTRSISSDPENLQKTWQYPALIVAVGNMEAMDTGEFQQYSSTYGLETRLYMYLKHADADKLAILRMRYAEAALELLNQKQKLGLESAGGVVPGSIAQLPSNVAPEGNALVGGVMTRFIYKLVNYGF